MIKITGKNFIAGERSSKGNDLYASFNPKTLEETNVKFTDATKEEIENALNKAEEAFDNISKEKIPVFLKEISKQIMKLGDQLLETADIETSLGIPRLVNERKRTCNQLKAFADYIKKDGYLEISLDKKDSKRTPPKPDIRRMLIPIGPVVVFPASNFPFAFGVCGGDTTSALAAGCPVVVKAHPSHPMTSELFVYAVNKAIDTCDFPKGIFSMIHGKNVEVSKQLVLHPKAEAIGFTGSLSAGRAIYNLAASREKPIPVFAEMGSINPIFIWDIKDDTSEQIASSITLGTGQFCTKPGVIFVKEKESEKLINSVIEKIKEKNPGLLLNENIRENLLETVNKTKETNNVELLFGGCRIENKNAFENTVFVTNSKTFLNDKNIQKEHFGPVVIFVKCKDNNEFLEIAKNLEGQLTGTIHVKDKNIKEIKTLFSSLTKKVGRIIINGVPTGVEVCESMNHGGPYPATTSIHFTSVGMYAVKRFLRPIAFQNTPKKLLPEELKKE